MSKYEFVKMGKRYIVKNSNGRVVSEKEKLQMENKELILKDIEGCNCQKETTKKLTKNKKRLKEIEQEEAKFPVLEKIVKNEAKKMQQWEKDDKVLKFGKENEDKIFNVVKTKTAQIENGDVADDIIKETDKSI